MFYSTLLNFRFADSIVYYGLSLSVTDFGLDIYLTQLAFGAVEFPARISCIFLLEWFGRKKVQAGLLLVSGVLCLIIAGIPEGEPSLCEQSRQSPGYPYPCSDPSSSHPTLSPTGSAVSTVTAQGASSPTFWLPLTLDSFSLRAVPGSSPAPSPWQGVSIRHHPPLDTITSWQKGIAEEVLEKPPCLPPVDEKGNAHSPSSACICLCPSPCPTPDGVPVL